MATEARGSDDHGAEDWGAEAWDVVGLDAEDWGAGLGEAGWGARP
ncbi:hypothetical protein MANAM107_04140 [Actinomyces capricornis]|uniref:Uncharacterized protein n=1 Tax=Actinomyces capricornis TaxID=2755559 RepID=A0ABM7U7S3_9ACTO|nr:hypothetical protein MANAM107_04140 [Actinomyces capricornis]